MFRTAMTMTQALWVRIKPSVMIAVRNTNTSRLNRCRYVYSNGIIRDCNHSVTNYIHQFIET